MMRAVCLPVIGFAAMGPPAVNRPFLAPVAALPSTQPVLPTPKAPITSRTGSGLGKCQPDLGNRGGAVLAPRNLSVTHKEDKTYQGEK